MTTFLILSCASKLSEQKQDNFDDDNNLILILRENSLQKFDSIILVKNKAELGEVLIPINITRMPGIEIKNIDFNKENLLVFNLNIKDLQNDINIINFQEGNIIYKKINNSKFYKIPYQYKLIKFYKIPKVNSKLNLQEIKN